MNIENIRARVLHEAFAAQKFLNRFQTYDNLKLFECPGYGCNNITNDIVNSAPAARPLLGPLYFAVGGNMPSGGGSTAGDYTCFTSGLSPQVSRYIRRRNGQAMRVPRVHSFVP